MGDSREVPSEDGAGLAVDFFCAFFELDAQVVAFCMAARGLRNEKPAVATVLTAPPSEKGWLAPDWVEEPFRRLIEGNVRLAEKTGWRESD